MADTSALKNRIRAAIKANDNQEITGPVLQQALLDMVDELNLYPELQEAINSEMTARQQADTQLQEAINAIKLNIDNGYVYAGIATPSTVPVSGKVFYVAMQAGTYVNFNGGDDPIVLTKDGIYFIVSGNDDDWNAEPMLQLDDVPTAGSDNLVKSDGIVSYIDDNCSVSILTPHDIDLTFSDKNGNVILLLKDGHIITKKFDSRKVQVVQELGDSTISVMSQKAVTDNIQIIVSNIEDNCAVADESNFDGDLTFSDKNGNVILLLKDGHIITKKFDSRNKQFQKKIYCIGDSITQGQTGFNPLTDSAIFAAYPTFLSSLLGRDVINLGAGGESTTEILTRMGWEGIKIVNGFTLYGNKTEVVLTNTIKYSDACNLKSAFDNCILNQFLMPSQGHPACVEQMTNVMIRNIPCTLRNDTANNLLYIKRNDAVDYDVDIKAGEVLSFKDLGSDQNAVYIICCGYNGDYPGLTNEQYIQKYVNAVARITSGKYLILGLSVYDSVHEGFADINAELSKYFGNRFVDIHHYLSSYQSFHDQGLTPTTDNDISPERAAQGVISDVAAITAGYKPSTYWRDAYIGGSVDKEHCNLFGYNAMAILVKAKLEQLGWV